jgi:cardiolipin hydrolase
MEVLLNLISDCLKSGEVTSSDRKEIKAYLKKHKFSHHQLNVTRSKVFDLLQDTAKTAELTRTITWIEEINKCLLPKENNNSNTNNRSYFSPGDDCENAIIHQLNLVKDSVKICVFTISENEITDAIINCHKRGKSVQVITDNDKINDLGNDIRRIAKEGITVKVDATRNHMHHKFCIFDNKTLLTGSYNWTKSAAHYNQENVLLTEDDNSVKSYLQEFDRLWKKFSKF